MCSAWVILPKQNGGVPLPLHFVVGQPLEVLPKPTPHFSVLAAAVLATTHTSLGIPNSTKVTRGELEKVHVLEDVPVGNRTCLPIYGRWAAELAKPLFAWRAIPMGHGRGLQVDQAE